MDILTSFTDFYDVWKRIDKWLLISLLILGFEIVKIIMGHLHKAGAGSFKFLEKYREFMNRREHNQKNIEMIDELKSEIKKCNDKMNVISTMMVELKTIIEQNDKKNSAEHMEMELQRNNARRENLKQELYAAYYKYKDRAEREGKRELSSVEYEGFWSMFHEYESPPLNGNGQVHSVIEVYMRGFIENPNRE
ncbi:MAG: hypothetical protein KH230_20380 [Enterocloster asparagiformis]|nr:hypothetical protein [Enterocloster asparagiformis]